MLSCLPSGLPSALHHQKPFDLAPPRIINNQDQDQSSAQFYAETTSLTSSLTSSYSSSSCSSSSTSSSRHSSTSAEASQALSPPHHMNIQEAPPQQLPHGGEAAYHGVFTPPGCSPAGTSAGSGSGGNGGYNVSPGATSAHLPSPMTAAHYNNNNNNGKRPTSPRMGGSLKRDHMHGND